MQLTHEVGQPLEEQKYLIKERQVLEKWWCKYSIFQHGGEKANVAYFDDELILCEGTSIGNMTLAEERQQSLLK